MKVLFVVPPFPGHVNPTVAVGAELYARGHTVAWSGPAGVLDELLPAGVRVYPAGDGDFGALHGKWRNLRGVAALKFLWDNALLPLAHAMLPGVCAAVEAFRPDVVVADQQAFAGALAARARGITWATSATTSAEFTRPFDGFPKIGAWVRGRIDELLAATGQPGNWDPRFSDQLVIVFSTPDLVGVQEPLAQNVFVGPAFSERPDRGEFPFSLLDPDRRRVLVTLGTLNREAGGRFYAEIVGAARELDVQLVIAAPAALVGPVAPGTVVRDFVPLPALLPHLDAVVTHGGHNTVCESLAHGLPLVVAPIRDDQPIIAGQVVAAGAGVRVKFGRARAPELRAALTAVLDDNGYRAGAEKIRASFESAGGAAAAADQLERLS